MDFAKALLSDFGCIARVRLPESGSSSEALSRDHLPRAGIGGQLALDPRIPSHGGRVARTFFLAEMLHRRTSRSSWYVKRTMRSSQSFIVSELSSISEIFSRREREGPHLFGHFSEMFREHDSWEVASQSREKGSPGRAGIGCLGRLQCVD